MRTIPLTGLKIARLSEWRAVVERAHRRIGWRALVWQMLTTLGRAGFMRKRDLRGQFRHRIRICNRCQIYDPVLRRCGPSDDSPIGCHCWVVLLACLPGQPYPADPSIPNSQSGCYADVVFPEEKCGWTTA